tara:strand:+ start:494 stop:694 length:201 start_codon:yes stop_codon:yes gene_type:complete
MKYTFTICEQGKEKEQKEGMSFKKMLASLRTSTPKWTGWIAYENKKGKYVTHNVLNGKKLRRDKEL